MAWFINSAFNNGYPWNDEFPAEFLTNFTTEGDLQLPYNAWRIKEGVNDGYPWIWYWFHEDVDIGGGDMVTGGTADNYPNGFTTHDIGGVGDQFDDDDMEFNDDIVDVVNGNLAIAFSGKMLALNSSDLAHLLTIMNNPSLIDNADRQLIQSVFGANIFDGIIICKQYPFAVTGALAATLRPKLFGVVPLYDVNDANDKYYAAGDAIVHYNMGSLSPDVFQAWEVEGIDFSIYLPFAGIFPLDIRNGDSIQVDLFVDLLTGAAEYYIKQNGQVTDVHRTTIGFDFPLNFTQGELSANGFGWGLSTITKLAEPALRAASGVSTVGGALAAGMAGAASDFASSNLSGKFAISAPQVGGATGFASPPACRVIAKIPKMFKGAYGYHETLGANRSTAFVRLDSCSGFVQCKEYKCNVSNATEEEKAEIERLLNSGVFI